ncbi:MAG: DoxX family protein [Flavipsychrobacter sp.]|nr:DoxX family protein [Flavipsychrobacter sp.]
MAIFGKLGRYSHTGLLLIRLVLGAMMLTHGFKKLAGGSAAWEKLGGAMGHFGIHAYPTFWGFMATFAESVCALLVILGLWFRPAAILITFTMIVATTVHLKKGDAIGDMELAIIYTFCYMGLILVGPGKYSVDKG